MGDLLGGGGGKQVDTLGNPYETQFNSATNSPMSPAINNSPGLFDKAMHNLRDPQSQAMFGAMAQEFAGGGNLVDIGGGYRMHTMGNVGGAGLQELSRQRLRSSKLEDEIAKEKREREEQMRREGVRSEEKIAAEDRAFDEAERQHRRDLGLAHEKSRLARDSKRSTLESEIVGAGGLPAAISAGGYDRSVAELHAEKQRVDQRVEQAQKDADNNKKEVEKTLEEQKDLDKAVLEFNEVVGQPNTVQMTPHALRGAIKDAKLAKSQAKDIQSRLAGSPVEGKPVEPKKVEATPVELIQVENYITEVISSTLGVDSAVTSSDLTTEDRKRIKAVFEHYLNEGLTDFQAADKVVEELGRDLSAKYKTVGTPAAETKKGLVDWISGEAGE